MYICLTSLTYKPAGLTMVKTPDSLRGGGLTRESKMRPASFEESRSQIRAMSSDAPGSGWSTSIEQSMLSIHGDRLSLCNT